MDKRPRPDDFYTPGEPAATRRRSTPPPAVPQVGAYSSAPAWTTGPAPVGPDWFSYVMTATGAAQAGDEVELRLGRMADDGRRFVPGLDHADFRHLLRWLRADKSLLAERTDEFDYIYRTPGTRSVKRIATNSTGTVVRVDAKTKGEPRDSRTPFFFDYRISVAKEEALEMETEVPGGWECKRHKVRESFTRAGLYRIDMTEATKYNNNPSDSGERAMEVEVELLGSAIEAANAAGRDGQRRLAEEIWRLLGAVHSMLRDSHWLGDLRTCPVPPELSRQLRSNELHPFRDMREGDFPGSMPVNLRRSHFGLLKERQYYVSEKTDGVRHMLLAAPQGVFLVDRKMMPQQIDYPLLQELFASNGSATLLDGEMVRNQKTMLPVFLVFDILTLKGEPVHQQMLDKRLLLIGQVVRTYREALERQQIMEGSLPFSIIGKSFFPKSEIARLCTCMKSVEHSRIYDDGKRYHNTDGVILTPNEVYQPRANKRMFKWKFNAMWSLDFGLRFDQQQSLKFQAWVGGNGDRSHVDFRDVSMSPSDLARMQSDIQRANLGDSRPVVECAFDTVTGMWAYHGLRSDKEKANHMSVVVDTMEVVAENISIHELQYRLCASPQEDMWDKEFEQAAQSIAARLLSAKQSQSRRQSAPQHAQSSSGGGSYGQAAGGYGQDSGYAPSYAPTYST